MSNGTTTTTSTPVPGAYVPTTEKPDVLSPLPSATPASSAPLPPGVTLDSIQKKTPSVQ